MRWRLRRYKCGSRKNSVVRGCADTTPNGPLLPKYITWRRFPDYPPNFKPQPGFVATFPGTRRFERVIERCLAAHRGAGVGGNGRISLFRRWGAGTRRCNCRSVKCVRFHGDFRGVGQRTSPFFENRYADAFFSNITGVVRYNLRYREIRGMPRKIITMSRTIIRNSARCS